MDKFLRHIHLRLTAQCHEEPRLELEKILNPLKVMQGPRKICVSKRNEKHLLPFPLRHRGYGKHPFSPGRYVIKYRAYWFTVKNNESLFLIWEKLDALDENKVDPMWQRILNLDTKHMALCQ